MGERIQEAADQVRAEGWKWVVTDYAAARMVWNTVRRVWPEEVALSEAEEKRRDELAARWDELALEYPNGDDDAPEEVQAELETIQTELDALEERERAFRPENMARGGATITLTGDGALRIERGYIRAEDEPQPEPEPEIEEGGEGAFGAEDEDGDDQGTKEDDGDAEEADTGTVRAGATNSRPVVAPVEEKAPALSAEVDHELSAHRTAALRVEIMRQPDLALRVLAHSLATATFYGGYFPTVSRIAHSYGASYGMGGSSIADSPARLEIKAAEDQQQAKLPSDHAELWAWLLDQDVPAIHGLLAVCIGRTAEAQGGDWTEEADARHVSAQAAQRAGLDMREWWTATRESYLSRITKAGILAAVREGAGEDAARRIEDMKKEPMAENAEALLAGKGWLPARLRVPAAEEPAPEPAPDAAEGIGTEGIAGRFDYPMAAE